MYLSKSVGIFLSRCEGEGKGDVPEYERLKTNPPALLMTHKACMVILTDGCGSVRV